MTIQKRQKKKVRTSYQFTEGNGLFERRQPAPAFEFNVSGEIDPDFHDYYELNEFE